MRPRLPLWAAWLLASGALVITALSTPAEAASPAAPSWPPLAAPVQPVAMTRAAELPSSPWLPGHRGIDLRAAVGQVVFSPGDGVVTFAGVVVDRPVVTVTLADGRRSSVEPVDPSVEPGSAVSRGQAVGVLADAPSHCRPAACVHWGVRDGDTYLDPLDLLVGFGPVRLLKVS